VSPLVLQSDNDMSFYMDSSKKYFDSGITDSLTRLNNHYQEKGFFAGFLELAPPLFPAILYLFEYGEGNTLPLALFYLIMSVALCWGWLYWLNNRGISVYWLAIFAVLPNPFWFTLYISTDLVFAIVFMAFYFSYTSSKYYLAAALLVLALISRPNALSLILFVVAHPILVSQRLSRMQIAVMSVLALICAIPLVPVYYPYFVFFVEVGGKHLLFGHSPREYVDGIFSALPFWLDKPFSWVAFLGAKLLYFVGLRPSWGSIPWEMLVARSVAGFILLPGFLYMLFRADPMHRLLAIFFALPIFLGSAQDRYNLPLQPLLFYFGVVSINEMSSFVKQRFKAFIS